MAKRNSEPAPIVEKAKVRVFFAELEGNNESVQEALRTMVSAMSRPVKIISEQRANGKDPALLEQPEIEESVQTVEDFGEAEPLIQDPNTQNTQKARGTGRKVDRNAGLKLVPNLNFRPTENPTFREFIDQKNAESDVEVVTAAVYYMQHIMNVEKIGPAHVMTAFKDASKPIPVDLKQTIRNIKKSKMWVNFTDLEDIRMTTQGDNHVEHEMGKNG